MKCTNCGLLLPSILIEMRCPQCGVVVLVQGEPSWPRQRTARGVRKTLFPHPKSRAESHGHAPGTPSLEGARAITLADVMRYVRVKSSIILLSFCVLQMILFGCLAWWVYNHPYWYIDVLITHELQQHQAVWIIETMKFVSMLGNIPYLLTGIVYLSAVLFWMIRHRLEAVFILLVFEVSIHLNPLLKSLVNRPRPTAMRVRVIEIAGGTSFPSGHVMSYVAFWGLLFLLCVFVLKRKSWWKRGLMLISALFIMLVGPSRVYLGEHWATDVLGAYLFEGALICLALILRLTLNDLLPRLHIPWKQGRAKQTR